MVKKSISFILIILLIIMIFIPSGVLADDTIYLENQKIEGYIYPTRGAIEAAESIFDIKLDSSEKRLLLFGKSLSDQRLSIPDTEYKYEIKDSKDLASMSDIRLSGKFSVFGRECTFQAEGRVRLRPFEDDILYMGILEGVLDIDGRERKISVGFEKFNDNIYFPITAYSGEEKGILFLFFGNSGLTEEMEKEIFHYNRKPDYLRNLFRIYLKLINQEKFFIFFEKKL